MDAENKRGGRAARFLLIWLAAVLGGYGLLAAVYTLPVPVMAQQGPQAAALLAQEGKNPRLIPGFTASALDNFTDALMLNIACYQGEGADGGPAWLEAARNNRWEYAGKGPYESAIAWLSGQPGAESAVSYARYWNGYLVPLKVLLLAAGYPAIRTLYLVAELVLLAVLAALMVKRKMARYLGALAVAVVFATPVVFTRSMQYAAVAQVTLGASIAVLALKSDRHLPELFFCAGIAVNYLDLLTTPLVTLGFPMILAALRFGGGEDWKAGARKAVLWGGSWLLGFGGMWAGKWLLGTAVTGRSVLADAAANIAVRTSADEGSAAFSRWMAPARNLEAYGHGIYIAVLAGYAAGGALWMAAVRKKSPRPDRGRVVLLAAAGVLPFIWYLLMANHSYIHYWMTCRNLAVTAFALCAVLTPPGREPEGPETVGEGKAAAIGDLPHAHAGDGGDGHGGVELIHHGDAVGAHAPAVLFAKGFGDELLALDGAEEGDGAGDGHRGYVVRVGGHGEGEVRQGEGHAPHDPAVGVVVDGLEGESALGVSLLDVDDMGTRRFRGEMVSRKFLFGCFK